MGSYLWGGQVTQGIRVSTGFNPLTNGELSVGRLKEVHSVHLHVRFQSPDQWGVICGRYVSMKVRRFCSEFKQGLGTGTGHAVMFLEMA